MKDIKLTPEKIWNEHTKAVEFNNSIDLYDNVKVNENFYIGKQWEGVKSNGLPTPQFNFLKRVTMFSVASVSTDNVKLNASPMASTSDYRTSELEVITDIANAQFAQLFEINGIGSIIREYSRNSAVDGDGATFSYWDETADSGQKRKGAIRTEVIQNTQIEVDNPNSRDIQSQFYIIISRRMMVRDARKRAKKRGVSDEEIEKIIPDDKETERGADLDAMGGDKVTVLLKMWKDEDTETVHAYECTQKAAMCKGEWDLKIKLYPITWFPWDYVQDCYHGQALISGLIPNQIFVNRAFAMTMISLMTTAYPKIIFDRTRIKRWDNRVGSAIPVSGGVDNAAKIMDPAQVSPQISQFIELAISYTQKFLGASDAALGDTRPDNTSAIIALQRASSVPMEMTKQAMLKSIEDLGLIYLDFMAAFYGKRMVEIENPYGEKDTVKFDFSDLRKIPMSIKIDAGASSYWSEIAVQQTLDNMLMNKLISPKEYVKRLPAGTITDREALIAAFERDEQAQKEQNTGTLKNPENVNPEEIPVGGGRGNGELQRAVTSAGMGG